MVVRTGAVAKRHRSLHDLRSDPESDGDDGW